MKVLFTEQASEDLWEIWDFLHGEANVAIADAFLDRINGIAKDLSTFPESGKAYDDLGPDIRGISFKPYTLFYRIRNNRIEVVRVLHGSRDIHALFQETVH